MTARGNGKFFFIVYKVRMYLVKSEYLFHVFIFLGKVCSHTCPSCWTIKCCVGICIGIYAHFAGLLYEQVVCMHVVITTPQNVLYVHMQQRLGMVCSTLYVPRQK
jgi:hypothetical protein